MRLKPNYQTPLLPMVLLFGILVLIASPSLNAPFILDDLDQLHQTASQHSVFDAFKPDCYGLYRPVKTVVFYALAKLFPNDPLYWRLFGLTIFLVSTGLMYTLSRRLFSSTWFALVSAAIWAMAPTQVSTIAWCSSLNIQLMAMTSLAAILLFDQLQSKPRSVLESTLFVAGILLAYAFSFFSYESSIVLPGLLLVWSLCRKQKILSRTSVATMLACGMTALALLGIRQLMKGNFGIDNNSIHGFSPLQLSGASGKIIWDHFSLWFWPFGRQAITGTLVNHELLLQSVQFVVSWICLAICALTGWLTRRNFPLLGLGLLFFFIAFFPMSNLVPLFNGPYADYYLIIPSVGLTLALTGSLKVLVQKLGAKTGSPTRLLTLLLLLTIVSTRVFAAGSAWFWSNAWKDELVLFTNTLNTFPQAYTAKASIARNLHLRGECTVAESLAKDAAQSAPWFMQARYVLISIYLKTGKLEEALAETRDVLETHPTQIFPWSAMGFLEENHLHDRTRAIEAYRVAQRLTWQTGSENSIINLARLLSLEDRDKEALAVLETAMETAPGAKSLGMIYEMFKINPDLFRNAAEAK